MVRKINRTSIEWCDFSWNPVTGCLGPDGEGPCPYCYAVANSKRFKRSFEPQLHVDRLKEPSKLKTGTKIFVCSMADLFGDWVPYGWVEKVLQVIQENPRHLYFLLTKYPQNLVSFQFPHRAWVVLQLINKNE